MKRNPNSNRSKKWIERNCLSSEKCISYIKDLFESYDIKYKISNDKISVTVGDIPYQIYVDYDNICIIVINKDNGAKRRYDGDSCWLDFVLDII